MRAGGLKAIGTAFLILTLPFLAQSSSLADDSSDPEMLLASRYWTTVLKTTDGRTIKKNLVLDPQAESTNPEKPAFLAPPDGAKVYHGYPLIAESCVDGYCYGAITNFLQPDDRDGCTIGDGFVQAPDGSRAGLKWEVRRELGHMIIEGPSAERWGVYYFGTSSPIVTTTDLQEMFKGFLPTLKKLHKQSKSK